MRREQWAKRSASADPMLNLEICGNEKLLCRRASLPCEGGPCPVRRLILILTKAQFSETPNAICCAYVY